ncbi:hypothetical protein MMC26_006939 [Xylographa opegraphella]|nr:hypothetical protein [Xylographa opegraphella]
MGWLWGPSKDGDPELFGNDPLKDLDPSLREFLQKESPVKYKTSEVPSQASSTTPSSPSNPVFSEASTQTSGTPSTAPISPIVASKSAFPDGRYAHLWSTYTPLADIEDATKTDQEKLLDVLNGFKERKAQIGRAAIENCADEQWAVSECYRSGKITDRLRLCHAENRSFERCYNMQARFLKALGYLSTYDRPPEVDEQIQMHADTLYHRMLDQERLVKEAKDAGLPIPTFPSLISSTRSTGDAASTKPLPAKGPASEIPLPQELQDLKPKVKAEFRARLKGLSPEEREVEEKAMVMEVAAGETVGKQVSQIYEETGKAKQLRKEQGKETFGDKISSFFGW